jgi:hypothetical protein
MPFGKRAERVIAICYLPWKECGNARIFVLALTPGKANRIIVKVAVTSGTIIPSKRKAFLPE